jgi:hypothetical protein
LSSPQVRGTHAAGQGPLLRFDPPLARGRAVAAFPDPAKRGGNLGPSVLVHRAVSRGRGSRRVRTRTPSRSGSRPALPRSRAFLGLEEAILAMVQFQQSQPCTLRGMAQRLSVSVPPAITPSAGRPLHRVAHLHEVSDRSPEGLDLGRQRRRQAGRRGKQVVARGVAPLQQPYRGDLVRQALQEVLDGFVQDQTGSISKQNVDHSEMPFPEGGRESTPARTPPKALEP